MTDKIQPELELEAPVICVICKLPIIESENDRYSHRLHEYNCHPRDRSEIAGCNCDIYAHADCCPECNP